MRVLPTPAGFISTRSPLRGPVIFSITAPVYSSSTSIVTSSIGSKRFPSFSWNKTRGRDIDSSNPSRRMFSIKTPICNSPLPATSNASPPGVSVTLIATFTSASRIRRSRITRLCTLLPSLPASGLSFMPKVTEMVGGSIGCAGKATSTERSQSVSATVALVMPARVTISPASAKSMGVCCKPRNAKTLDTRNCSIFSPVRDKALIVSPALSVPASTRPVKIRPIKGSADKVVANILKGSLRCANCAGCGTCFTTKA